VTNQSSTPTLSAQDVRRLTLWKWRYSLESAGFTTEQAEHLLFLKWQHDKRRSADDLPEPSAHTVWAWKLCTRSYASPTHIVPAGADLTGIVRAKCGLHFRPVAFWVDEPSAELMQRVGCRRCLPRVRNALEG
jgi:hypothetical protein